MLTSLSIGNDTATVRSMTTTLGAYIRDRRLELGYRTQSDFAERAGVNRAHLSQIESGKIALPNADLRRKLAKAMGVSHLDILVAAGELEPEEAVSAGGVLTDAEALPPAIRDLLTAIEWTPRNTVRARTMLETIRDTQRPQPASDLQRLMDMDVSDVGPEGATRIVPAKEDDGE